MVSCLAALSGIMGARLAVPLETRVEREMLVVCLMAILEDCGAAQRAHSLSGETLQR